MAVHLIRQNVHNLNFVSPDHFWPHVEALCIQLRREGHQLPFIYNCSGYSRTEMIVRAAKMIDIFIPDFKFADENLARKCMGDGRYPELVLAALQEMVAGRGFLRPWDIEGRETAQEGVLVRHLVLPGQVENSIGVLKLLKETFGEIVPISLMSQFQPTRRCLEHGVFTRRVKREEYQRVLDMAKQLGFKRIYAQPLPRDLG